MIPNFAGKRKTENELFSTKRGGGFSTLRRSFPRAGCARRMVRRRLGYQKYLRGRADASSFISALTGSLTFARKIIAAMMYGLYDACLYSGTR